MSLDMPFNINSSQQMQDYLFNFLKLKPLQEKNDKGNYSVDVNVLTHYAEKEDIEFCKLLMDYRKLNKCYSTYIKGLEKYISEETGNVHPSFSMGTTVTGRSSSQNPNKQNISKHGDIIKGIPWTELRKVFSSELDKYYILEADYVGAEVKVCAMLTDDDQLCDDLNNDMDQHSHWAGVIFGIDKPLSDIKKHHGDERFLAKNNFTFANLFGASPLSIATSFREHDFYIDYVRSKFELARQVKGFNNTWDKFFVEYSEKHLTECQNEFYNRYTKVKEWQDGVVQFYYDNGYIENPFGFRRRYPMKKNEIINFPIQSTSFHLLLDSLIKTQKQMIEYEMKSILCSQVHDSGFFLVHIDEAEELCELISYEMENKDFEWTKKVRLESEIEIGKTWEGIKVDNKPFRAKHKNSGEILKYNIFHWFAHDFGFDENYIYKVLNGKKDENEQPYQLDGWELEYTK